MAKFRKRQIEVEAVLMTERTEIKTLEGTMIGNPGDWLITGIAGEKCPCKGDCNMPREIKTIKITRVEGPYELTGKEQTFSGWEEATAWLKSQAHTFPTTGGYDKHDFTIEWMDGITYNGRLDCKASEMDDNDLDIYEHVKQFVTFHAGLAKNPWMGKERYHKFLNDMEKIKPGIIEGYKNLYTNYL